MESRSRVLPIVATAILAVIAFDVGRRAMQKDAADAPPPADTSSLAAASPPAVSAAADAARRAQVRQRILADSANGYLFSTVLSADSTVRRWSDDRIDRPLRIAMIRGTFDGFREDFVSNASWAVQRWNGVIPIPFVTGADSATADIVIVWTAGLDSNRAGRTDLTWDNRGVVLHALVVLSTRTSSGAPLDGARMSALALHEMGHAIGLNHSPDRNDALHPIAYATDLSERDRRTARLLYDLPPGSIR